MNDSFTKEQVADAYGNAPDFVRATFNDEKTTQLIMGLQSKYQLHVDQAGFLGKEVGYLLLGLTNPEKFANRLKGNGFSDQMVTDIAKELNQNIFMPLRAEEMKTGGTAASPAPAGEEQPKTYFHLENKIAPAPARPAAPLPPHIAPLPPRFLTNEATIKIQAGSRNHEPPPKAVLPRSAMLPAQKPMDASILLEDHEEPHIEINKIAPRPAAPLGAGAPTNLPGVVPPATGFPQGIVREIPVAQPAPAAQPAVAPIAPRPAPAPAPAAPVKSYGADPYREPIDEPPTA